jgi:uncharacterized protein (TIGR00266 family)
MRRIPGYSRCSGPQITDAKEECVTIPDLPTPAEVDGRTSAGLSYKILGTIQQTLLVDLPAGRTIYSDAGAMSWMTASIGMNTQGQGGLGGMLKRAVSGATVFIVDFTAEHGPGQIAFSTDFPGKVLAFELGGGQGIVMHKHAFLCAEKTVILDVYFTRRLGAGAFGGEGFVLQKLSGTGAVFAELDGDAIEYRLKAGEQLRIEPGHVAMFDESVKFDIEMIQGFTNILMGGEGLFLATLTGPGRIWLHSLTPSKVAHRLAAYLPASR